MSHYKPYSTYRDFGVEWIGEVPKHWTIQPVKHVFSTQLGKMISPKPSSEGDVLVPYHRAQTVQWEKIEHAQVEKMWVSEKDIASYGVRKGDLLICEGGDVCRAAICDIEPAEPTIIQNSIHRVRNKEAIKVEWLLHLMKLVRSSEWIDVLCNKNTIVHFTSEKLNSLRIPVPPVEEHAAILGHLDRETTRIDFLIAKKTRFVELLKEKRQALITHAVTKGLDPNVKMKDSGEKWLGDIPAHWDVIPSQRLFSESKERAHLDDQHLSATQKYGVIPLAEYERLECRQVTHAEKNLEQRKHAEVDNFVISMRSFEGGIERVRAPGCVRSSYIVLIAGQKAHIGFFTYLFKSSSYIQGLQATATFIRDGQDLSFNNFRQLRLPYLNIDEQMAISDFLDRVIARIDLLSIKTQHSIDLLKERRSALITAAVTGKIDLRNMNAVKE